MINESRKPLRFMAGKLPVIPGKVVYFYPFICSTQGARADDILDLEFLERDTIALLLHDPSVFPRREPGVVLGFGAGDYHLSTCEDQGGGSRLADADDDGGEAFRCVLGVPDVLGEMSEIEMAAEIATGDNVLDLGEIAIDREVAICVCCCRRRSRSRCCICLEECARVVDVGCHADLLQV